MKIIFTLLLIGIVGIILLRVYAKNATLQNSFPEGAYPGVTEGKLALCKSSPNCVSSFADPEDSVHYAQALSMPETMSNVKQTLIDICRKMPYTTVAEDQGTYLRVEFRSKLIGYVDDVEFLIDEEQRVIHFRSASRVGYSDMGVNRKRIETIRSHLSK